MARRLYLGRLPPDARAEDVAKIFDGFGRIVDCRVMTGFGFVEFESSKDAEDAVFNFNGKSFMGANIVVEFAKESRPRRDPFENDRNHGARSRRPSGIRLVVSGISRDTSWQDLKDFGREAGSVSFADIDRDLPGQGVLEYLHRDDADRAVKDLDGKDLRGRPVRVAYDESRGGVDNHRRDDRRDDRHREERYHREERSSHRRERSRSPRRAEHDDRRPRASPPARRDYDERKPAGDDHDRRRDERGARRDDKDDRYDDRAMRHTNGDGGWAR
ncbi:hypothetical protein SCLCIDRAFT_1215345 [Scleroderma citrinum Foug A]|uniref:RRM domain-containing protein n=1 Tax=Scleroderma citrinum Foug A TaxID=1036808 RepID=A0A0C2ZK62_9AGAM|nr:hypothetical protein SCLCIDRAFT_1215345 [Scleroderma citrinum Foug A]